MFVFRGYLPSVTGFRHAPIDKPQNDVSPGWTEHFVEDDKTIVGNPFTIIPIGSMGLVYLPTTEILLTGAFVCHRQNTPRTNTTHSSAATQFKRIRTLQLPGPCSRSSIGFGVQRPVLCRQHLGGIIQSTATGHWRKAANPSTFRVKKCRDTSSQAFKV